MKKLLMLLALFMVLYLLPGCALRSNLGGSRGPVFAYPPFIYDSYLRIIDQLGYRSRYGFYYYNPYYDLYFPYPYYYNSHYYYPYYPYPYYHPYHYGKRGRFATTTSSYNPPPRPSKPSPPPSVNPPPRPRPSPPAPPRPSLQPPSKRKSNDGLMKQPY